MDFPLLLSSNRQDDVQWATDTHDFTTIIGFQHSYTVKYPLKLPFLTDIAGNSHYESAILRYKASFINRESIESSFPIVRGLCNSAYKGKTGADIERNLGFGVRRHENDLIVVSLNDFHLEKHVLAFFSAYLGLLGVCLGFPFGRVRFLAAAGLFTTL